MKSFFDLYVKLFSNGSTVKFNDKLLSAALRARGYNNFRNYEESGEHFFIMNVLAHSNPTVCIDIGANIGNYTEKLLQHTQATVISFEPLPAAFAELQKKVKSFGKRSILENKGVGEKNDNLVLNYNPSALAHASFSEEINKVPYVKNSESINAKVVSIDTYFENSKFSTVDFIKIDTEGFEYEVLKGAHYTIDRFKPKYIQIEFNWHHMFRNISLNYIAEMLPDYDVFQLIPGGWIKRDAIDPLSNIYCFANFVFVRH